MYIPNWFREESVPKLHDFIRTYGFGTLITEVGRNPFASHLPFLLDSARGSHGTLRAHMARPNPQWRVPGALGALPPPSRTPRR